MADLGATFTDAEITKTEKELKDVYNEAYKDILQKQKDFNKKYKIKEEKKLKQVTSGSITQDEFDHWKKGQVFQGKQWENKRKQILKTIYDANSIAANIINGKTSGVFTFNANYTAYDLEHGAGVNFGFGLYDESTVINLIKNNPQLLPKWKIDQPKDYIWNQKKLNRQVNLGIIEGERLDKIATRLTDSLCTQNYNKMRTFARTAMTGAQNSGRQIRLEEAKKLGINLKKEWMATLDEYTRHAHRDLDGQKVETDQPFEVNGQKIMYPGDPQADPSLVYNCRCTMVGDIDDYPSTYDRYDNIDGKRIRGMTYKEWENAKKKGDNISPVPLTYSYAKQIQKTNNPDGLPQEVLDIIGYKGDPIEYEKLLKTINPNFNNESYKYSEYHQNCQRCTACYELGRRGYDVEALAFDGNYPDTSDIFDIRGYKNNDTYLDNENSKYKINQSVKTTTKSVIQAMNDWGNGSRASLTVVWRNSNTAHVVNVENFDGKILILDAQSGHKTENIEAYLSKTKCKETELLRLDTAPYKQEGKFKIERLEKMCKARRK